MVRLGAFLIVLSIGIGLRAEALPGWVTPYPGATAKLQSTPGMVTATYVTAARPEAVIEHYKSLWEAAGQTFAANFNGTGTAIRGSAAECDLLVVVRESEEGSQVKTTCAARSQAPDPNAGREVISSNGTARGTRPSPFSQRDPRTAAMLANADAEHRARVARMGEYDKPVYPRPPRDPEGIPLAWPGWLVHMPGASTDLDVRKGEEYGKSLLKSQFRTVRPMSEIHQYYEALMNANGFRVGESKLQTGQTLGGVMQNKDGMVKGTWQPNGIGRGGMSTTVWFSRSKLNDPIRVVLEVRLIQIYSNR